MQIRQKYLNDLLYKFGPFCLQHSKTFDISHAFLRVTIAELSMLKQVRFFGPPCIITRQNQMASMAFAAVIQILLTLSTFCF